MLTSDPQIPWVVYSLLFNIFLFIIEGAIIYYSSKFTSKPLMILGILFFVMHVVTRYFDVLWDLLSGSLLFIITGINTEIFLSTFEEIFRSWRKLAVVREKPIYHSHDSPFNVEKLGRNLPG